MSSIPCGLKRVLRHHDVLAPHFEAYATSIGIMRHVVSMVANHVLLSGASVDSGNLFLFYTRVWSAVDRRARNETGGTIQHFDTEVDLFFENHDTVGLPSFLVPVMCRQQECNALATAACMHLQSFPMRMMRWIKANLVSMCRHADVRPPATIGAVAAMIWKLVCAKGDFDVATLNNFICKQHSEMECIKPGIVQFALDEYDRLKDFRAPDSPTMSSAINGGKHAHLLIRHMHHLSLRSEELLRGAGDCMLTKDVEVDLDDLEGDTVIEVVDDDEPTAVHWPRGTRPSPFSLLPVAKLKRAMVYYGFTEIKNFVSNLRSKKRKMMVTDCVDTLQENMAADKVLGTLLDLQKLKVKRHIGSARNAGGWVLACFRTDGVKTVLTFCTGMASAKAAENVCCLCDAGYDIPKPKAKIDVESTERGLFRVAPKRNDIEIGSVPASCKITVVDPGFCRPIQSASLSAQHLLDPSLQADVLARQSTFHHLTEATWMEESGRRERGQKEMHRRARNQDYKAALEELGNHRRRSCLEFLSYSQAAMRTLVARSSELVTFARSMFRWTYERKLQGFLDRLADSFYDRSTTRVSRQAGVSHLSEDERAALREQLRRAKETRAQKHVVFFGDGTFSCTQRGHVSIPKKRLLKQMAVRGLTFLLCESYTSKRCPCGAGDLIDGNNTDGMRVRVHKNGGCGCEVLNAIKDRDELACVNMLLATSTACRGCSWPTHLTRG